MRTRSAIRTRPSSRAHGGEVLLRSEVVALGAPRQRLARRSARAERRARWRRMRSGRERRGPRRRSPSRRSRASTSMLPPTASISVQGRLLRARAGRTAAVRRARLSRSGRPGPRRPRDARSRRPGALRSRRRVRGAHRLRGGRREGARFAEAAQRYAAELARGVAHARSVRAFARSSRGPAWHSATS